MDWRHRKYYLIKLNDSTRNWWEVGQHDDFGEIYEKCRTLLTTSIPGLKFHQPYNHFKYNTDFRGYDGAYETTIGKVQMMVSCKSSWSSMFLVLMNQLCDNYNTHVGIVEITKDITHQ